MKRHCIATVGRFSPLRRAVTAAAAVVAFGYAAGAQQTQRPEAVWTPAADAPVGTLSHALEGQRHDFFIELAQKGDIDLVFFGRTTTEMWWWPARGKSVWDRELGSLKAANFGSQGTHADSLVWRMQNGELDGYQAKLVVLAIRRLGEPMPPGSRFPDLSAGYAAVIAEIRARQPQAKILLLAAFPRGLQTIQDGGSWRRRTPRRSPASSTTRPCFMPISANAFTVPTAPTTARLGRTGRCRSSAGRSSRCGRKSFSPGSIGSFADDSLGVSRYLNFREPRVRPGRGTHGPLSRRLSSAHQPRPKTGADRNQLVAGHARGGTVDAMRAISGH